MGSSPPADNPLSPNSEKWLIMKNVLTISVAFMVLFTSFSSMSSLQSSINKVDGLGSISLALIYVSLVISAMFVPSYLNEKLTAKWAMVFSMLCYSTYIGAQFYPSFYTLIPGAIIIGFGAAPLWISKCAYLSQISGRYSELTGQPLEPVILRFFGIFFAFFQSSSIWGNMISAAVLGSGDAAANKTSPTEDQLALCGANYCPKGPPKSDDDATTANATAAENENFNVDITRIYTLAGIFLACSLVAPVIVAVLVDPVSRFGERNNSDDEKEKKEKLSGVKLLMATFSHMRHPYMILIIPITLWSGLEQGFFGADFTAGYITCAYGVEKVGLVLITYGVCDATFSFAWGALANHVGRILVFILGGTINATLIVVLFTWAPNPEQGWVFFVIAGLWGVADAIWQTQINALYGALFGGHEEAGFSNYRLWESLGFLFAYILQTQVCIDVKLWILTAFLGIGMGGYLVVESMEWKRKKAERPAAEKIT